MGISVNVPLHAAGIGAAAARLAGWDNAGRILCALGWVISLPTCVYHCPLQYERVFAH